MYLTCTTATDMRKRSLSNRLRSLKPTKTPLRLKHLKYALVYVEAEEFPKAPHLPDPLNRIMAC